MTLVNQGALSESGWNGIDFKQLIQHFSLHTTSSQHKIVPFDLDIHLLPYVHFVVTSKPDLCHQETGGSPSTYSQWRTVVRLGVGLCTVKFSNTFALGKCCSWTYTCHDLAVKSVEILYSDWVASRGGIRGVPQDLPKCPRHKIQSHVKRIKISCCQN